MLLDMINTNAISKTYREVGKGLLTDLGNKKITMDEYQWQSALMGIHCGWEQIRIKGEPSPPVPVMEYRQMKTREKMGIAPEFWKREDVATYLNERDKVRAHNYMVESWLNEMLSIFKKRGDSKHMAIVTKRMEEERVIDGNK